MTKRDKLNRLAKAANHLRAAAESLAQIADDKGDDQYLRADARYYQFEIQELISCDHEQAGLDALIHIVSRELEARP